MSWITIILVGLSLVLHQAESSGVFELRLMSFDNDAARNDLGKCCIDKNGPNSDCYGLCRPRFRVCLKEYQVKIDPKSPCTFGDVITSELGTNPATDTPQTGFDNSIAFQFPFTWPGTFSLIVEAWHGNQTSHSAVLITRLTRQRYLDVSENWNQDTHKSKYSTLRFEYRVTCEPHYYGKGCENLCRPRDDSFGHFSCSLLGERVCLAGWSGDYCTKPVCSPGCDEQHGHCTKPNECKCQSGWEGSLCNQCQRYPGCMHGTCIKPWDCLCNEGWGGLFCNQDLNFCTNHKPCQNGGTCFNTGQGSYTCSCPTGFNGTKCEVLIDDCIKSTCLNGGICIENGSFNVCQCQNGFIGARCEMLAHSCNEQTCQNGGTCTNTKTDYKCLCKSGFIGVNCEVENNVSCASNPCKNKGICNESASDSRFQCICPTGFTGEKCEANIDDCVENPCQNGGTCLDQVNEFRCQCVPGFVGNVCQNRVDYCTTKPCANGGTCTQLINDYTCSCATGFAGKDCSEEVNKCQTNPCQNGGTCLKLPHSFKCNCPLGFLGRQCEEVSSSAAPSARISSESNLTTEHVVVIATISTFVPLVVLIAVGVIICLKQRRKREKARADEEARLQNEQNTANSSFAKRGMAISSEAHMIKNSWGKCTNNVLSSNLCSPDDCSISNISVNECEGFSKPLHQLIDGRPVYSLQRTRSIKQLNTDPGARAPAILAAKLHGPDYEQVKRLSVMSNVSAVCGSSDTSLLKRPLEKESNGVFVIEEHFHVPDAISCGLYATEV